ncbi:thioesterase family protein [Mycobacterium sp. MYCO198283]|uniref:acyl-CoA thioesterase n=1 Tax=Mycobacterium sp. MYCO198283 TaxID=2883505 RepID=UPI001E40B7B3|nr:acyl-CoA thioesterase domain-containing protein [Mycobacterium sp. MYCO198283]MCG5434419.1 thioesterase family protein [Mycobacterium sp. MYCO198283]
MTAGVLRSLLDVIPGGGGSWTGPAYGPAGKRAYGGQLAAQSLAVAGRTVDPAKRPTSMHVQFLRGGDAGEPVDYVVDEVYDGRTAATRRVGAYQAGRLLTATTASFAAPLPGVEHGHRELGTDPDALPRTGPPGPAPSMPSDEVDIRIADTGAGGAFRRALWWRVTAPLPDDPLLHACLVAFVTDIYGIDPVLRVHGHSMAARTHRTATTDAAIWFHRRVHADRWNLLDATSPAASQGRGVMTAALVGADGTVTATLVQEGLVASRE